MEECVIMLELKEVVCVLMDGRATDADLHQEVKNMFLVFSRAVSERKVVPFLSRECVDEVLCCLLDF